jgi:hypothetical protein
MRARTSGAEPGPVDTTIFTGPEGKLWADAPAAHVSAAPVAMENNKPRLVSAEDRIAPLTDYATSASSA